MMDKLQNKESSNIRSSPQTFREELYSTCLAAVLDLFEKHTVLSSKCVWKQLVKWTGLN
jgi:hypothetical protein